MDDKVQDQDHDFFFLCGILMTTVYMGLSTLGALWSLTLVVDVP